MSERFTLKPAQRLRKNADFARTRQVGKPYRCPYFVMYTTIRALESADVSSPRIGISASRRVGNAVHRNRARRRIKELFRLNQSSIADRADIIVSLRPPIANATFSDITRRFAHALEYNWLTKEKEPDK